MNCINYVITHRDYPILEDGMYRALCVGNYHRDGWLSERGGENISEYNDRLNETTGIFWIWKNSPADIVGLSHYRRYFCNNRHERDQSRLDEDRVREILNGGYDIILTEKQSLWRSRGDIIRADVGDEKYCEAVGILVRLMEKTCPEYLRPLRNVLNGRWMYTLNMFVAHKETLDRYCEWLFSFICDAADALDVRDATERQKRTIGFFSETMMTVWLMRQKLRVYSLPYVNTDEEAMT